MSKPVAATTLTSTVEVTKTVTVTAPPTAVVPKTVMETDGTYRIGVDIEPDAPLEEALWDSVLRPEELAWLDARPAGDRARLARLIFSAKECAYKCQYPLTRALLDFDDFSIAIEAGAFHARFQRPVSPFGQGAALSGRWTAAEGALLTALALRP